MKKTILMILALGIYLIFIPDYSNFALELKAFAALAIIQILWIGRVFPLAHSSIILMLILSFHFFSYEETLSYIGSDIVWLLFSTFFISHSFINTGLASRVSLAVLKMSKGSSRSLILISYVLMFLLSLMIPSNVGKGSLVSSVFDDLLKNVRKIGEAENLGKSLFIGIAYITSISGSVVATGASSTIYTFGILNENMEGLNYVSWLLLFAPPTILFALILWLISLSVFPPEKIDSQALLQTLNKKSEEMGRLSLPEIKVIFILILILALWSTQHFHNISIPLTGLLGAALTITPKIGVWTWEEAKRAIDWDMVIFFAATIMVAGMLIKTGTINLVSDFLVNNIPLEMPILVLFLLILITALIRLIFVNVLGLLTIILPLSVTVGQSLSGLSPGVVTMAVFLAGVPGFLFVTQSPVHLIAFSYKYFTERDLLKIGSFSMIAWVMVITLAASLYWRLLL
ncbi:SLC13 family permease [Planomicrobium okeanokoites]|uniref:SLC13 family permease n=1 Tax=Planomicrobium okeanokoites TaxID=244 RepID=UPI00249297CE|nr:SLC13 family permease [Planomicrobium okeanokoites]